MPTRGIVYDRCRFEQVGDDVLRNYKRHGAWWDRYPDRRECFTENFTTNASVFLSLCKLGG